MMKIYLNSIGCRLNQSEIETIARDFMRAGHQIVNDPAVAEKVVVNTCVVTAEAAKDARKMTRAIHRQNVDAEIILTGCYATVAPHELSRVKGAGRIVSNRDKDRLLQIVDPRATINGDVHEVEPIMREMLASPFGNTRAFVKVQDGCDNRCTFCVTTIARGRGRSRHLGDVIAEVQALADSGYQEAVLTGVHLGSYGQDLGNGTGLKELVSAILTRTGIKRLRLSSLEPWDIAPGFFDLWDDPRLLPHLHVPLQSGSDRILRLMARRTSRRSFRELVDRARFAIPDLSLTTDMIAGFPGETERDFTESLDFIDEIGFARLHVFSYSARPGTAAAKMPGHLPRGEIKRRARHMIERGDLLATAFHRTFEGTTRHVLWETAVGADQNGLRWIGYTDNYIRVETQTSARLANTITAAVLSNSSSKGMIGTIAPPASAANFLPPVPVPPPSR